MGVFKKGKNWYIDYYVKGRRKREKIGPSRRQTELVFQKRRVQIAEEKFFEIKRSEKILFDDFAEMYINTYSKPNKRSWVRDQNCIDHLKLFFENRYLHEITPLSIEQYKKLRMNEVSPRTVNIELSCLKAMFNKAISWGKALENPVTQVKLLKEDDRRLRYLETEEMKTLIENCPAYLRPIVIMALHTGMRKREILDLRWENVDLKRRLIYVANTKTDEKREIATNSILHRTLAELRKERKGPYVFPGKEDGKPYIDIRKGFRAALKKSDIKNFRFHDLRHTFASHLVMRGVDLKTVQELLGHKSIEMTMRYSHLSASHKQIAVERLCEDMDTIWTPDLKGGQFRDIVLALKQLSSKDLERLSACSSVDRTSASGAESRRFKSCQARQASFRTSSLNCGTI